MYARLCRTRDQRLNGFQIEMPFAPCDRAMLDAHFLSAVADLVVVNRLLICTVSVCCMLIQVAPEISCFVQLALFSSVRFSKQP